MLPDGERELPELVISLAPDVHRQVLQAAAAEGVSVSAWMTAAARRVLMARDGRATPPARPRNGRLMTPAERSAARRRIATSASDDPSAGSGSARWSG